MEIYIINLLKLPEVNFSRVHFFKKGFPAILCVDQNVNISLTDLFIPNMTETVVNSKKTIHMKFQKKMF